jgi:ribulose-phosphate 3-epimerase
MKISASIYSDKNRSLELTIADLSAHHVDLLHVDCNDDLTVFDDIKVIRKLCSIPIDLHIITANPSNYFELLRQNPVDYVTFQFEHAPKDLKLPTDIPGKKGLSIVTPTNVDVFDQYPDYDFILLMATVPGQSGGKFDSLNFQKIRSFKKRYPSKSIHVDGGVNGEVSFILRNMGVVASVSGSFLFNAPSIGHALMDLTKRSVKSQFCVQDFMIPYDESPSVTFEGSTSLDVLKSIDHGRLGFTLVVDSNQHFLGLVSNADVRKQLIDKNGDFEAIELSELINKKPLSVLGTATVNQMLELIESANFPILYLPVTDTTGKALGIVTFVDLIKGEL